jgi:DNA-binding GntR family transcriptional regulator
MTTIAVRIQKTLTSKIINGELRPGHKLDEKSLATEFGVSRTPIREALRELGARGLIDLVPHRGGIVAQISLDQLADMLDAECEMEGLCARLASQRMSAVEKGALLECHRRAQELTKDRDETRYLEINQQFHDLICDGAHNGTLATMTRELRTRLGPFRQSQSETQARRLALSHDEHAAIVDAIQASDPDAAYDAMRRHNARLSSSVLALLRAGAQIKS